MSILSKRYKRVSIQLINLKYLLGISSHLLNYKRIFAFTIFFV